MQRTYYCRNCGAPVAHMQRYCSHCGINLQPASQRDSGTTHPVPAPYGPDYINHQATNRQQTAGITRTGKQMNTAASENNNIKPLRKEILNLISSLVDRQAVNN
jgi:hypothetical protein